MDIGMVEFVTGLSVGSAVAALGYAFGALRARRGAAAEIQSLLDRNFALAESVDLEKLLHSATKQSQAVDEAERVAAQGLADQLKADLKESERRRLEVGAVVGQVCEERRVVEDLYLGLVAGCARAQHLLTAEIDRLTHLARVPPSPAVARVVKESEALLQQAVPVGTTEAEAEAKVAAAAEGRKA